MDYDYDVFKQNRRNMYKQFCDVVEKIEHEVADELNSSQGLLIDDLEDVGGDLEKNLTNTNKKKCALPKALSTCRCCKTKKIVEKVECELGSNLRKILKVLWKNPEDVKEKYKSRALKEINRLLNYMSVIELQHYIVYVANKTKCKIQ